MVLGKRERISQSSEELLGIDLDKQQPEDHGPKLVEASELATEDLPPERPVELMEEGEIHGIQAGEDKWLTTEESVSKYLESIGS